MSPGEILGEFRGTGSPGELEDGLREYEVPRACLQGVPSRVELTDGPLEQVGGVEAPFSRGAPARPGQTGPRGVPEAREKGYTERLRSPWGL